MRDSVLSLIFLLSTAVAGLGKSPPASLPRTTPPTNRPDPQFPQHDPNRESYVGVVVVLLAAALLGTAGLVIASWMVANLVLVDTAVILVMASGILVGVVTALITRTRRAKDSDEAPNAAFTKDSDDGVREAILPGSSSVNGDSLLTDATERGRVAPTPERHASRKEAIARFAEAGARVGDEMRALGPIGMVRVGTAFVGVLGIFSALPVEPATGSASALVVAIIAALSLIAAGLALTAARYLAGVEPAHFPEGPSLSRGARVVAWIFVLAALSMGLVWAEQQTILRVLHYGVLLVAAASCYGLFTVRRSEGEALETFPLDLPVLRILGSRTNILASILDAAEQQLGIDLRSTWALTVVRRSLEPLAITLALAGWLSTSLTVVGLEEQGLVERLGVPLTGQPLGPGLHLHWPFPVDRVFRLPVQRVQAIAVGHEGEEGNGPENVLWAREHAANEYTLLLGNGRDLITVDAAVQYRIADARAWRYHCQNPADALRAIAYRAVMRSTVNRTLSEALSENVVVLTARMRRMVQQDADALGLGIEVVAFTVGGMHPPVVVAPEYQSVVSAEISKVTAVVNAQVFRNQTVPATDAAVLVRENTAQADGANDLAKAAGEAWSFRTLESQYRSEPQEYVFRRRLETLEKNLAGRHFTVVDSRFQRDGGELWLNP